MVLPHTYSEWFGGAQRLRQGCMLSLLLPNIFSIGVFAGALRRLNGDVDILVELVHVEEVVLQQEGVGTNGSSATMQGHFTAVAIGFNEDEFYVCGSVR